MRKRFQTIILSLRGKWSEYGQIRGHTEGIYKAAGKENNIDSMKGICRAHMPFLFVFSLDIQQFGNLGEVDI